MKKVQLESLKFSDSSLLLSSEKRAVLGGETCGRGTMSVICYIDGRRFQACIPRGTTCESNMPK